MYMYMQYYEARKVFECDHKYRVYHPIRRVAFLGGKCCVFMLWELTEMSKCWFVLHVIVENLSLLVHSWTMNVIDTHSLKIGARLHLLKFIC